VDTHGPVVVATKLQDCFGLSASPEIAGRRIQFQLLSPAQRPLAVTDDLASFWAGPYRQVRSEMRGRYPKHPWPENP
jgi:ATP-dependent helicase HrpB